MIRNIKMLIILVLCLLMLNNTNAIICGYGIPVLTRINTTASIKKLQYQCLCPMDYYGIQCRQHRKINCYTSTKSITPNAVLPQNYHQIINLTVKQDIDCYLELKDRNFISWSEYIIKKTNNQINLEALQTDLDSEIIWANDTQLFDDKGELKYIQGYNYKNMVTNDSNGNIKISDQDQKIIMYGKGPYQFAYRSEFLGFKLTNSNFSVVPRLIKILNNSQLLQRQTIQFTNYNEYLTTIKEIKPPPNITELNKDNKSLQDLLKEVINPLTIQSDIKRAQKQLQNRQQDLKLMPQIEVELNLNIKNAAEFGMIRLQTFMVEQYGKNRITQIISINNADVRIPVRIPEIAQVKVYNINFYKATSNLLYLFFIIAILALLFGLYKWYIGSRKQKLRQIQERVQNQSQRNDLN